jgi:hypothetical protein
VRGGFVLAGGPGSPDPAVIDREGMTHVAWEGRDPAFTVALADTFRARGNKIVVQRDPTWNNPILTGAALGIALSDDIKRLGGDRLLKSTAMKQCAAMPDIEHTHNADYVLECYHSFRSKRTGRGFYLTTEWHQSGWFSAELVAAINNDPLFFYLPQAYETNAMNPVDPRIVIKDCTDHGIRENKVQVFLRYDRLDIGWDGWCYDYNKAR